MARPGKKRLSMDIPIQMHKELKILSSRYNISITVYVLRLLVDKIKKEKQYE